MISPVVPAIDLDAIRDVVTLQRHFFGSDSDIYSYGLISCKYWNDATGVLLTVEQVIPSIIKRL